MDYKELLDLISKKDKSGLEALYSFYGQKFYAYAVKKWLFNEDEAWEVVYQTLDTLILKLPEYTFESQSHFDNLIFKIFINFLRQSFRKKRKKQLDIVYVDEFERLDNSSFEISNEESGTSKKIQFNRQSFDEFYSNEKLENPKLLFLKDALQEMNAEERDILLLRAQNYSYEEISKMLKIENNQLKVKHFRLKKRLTEIINNKIA